MIFEVQLLERLGLSTKRSKVVLILCLVVLPISVLVYHGSYFNFLERIPKDKTLEKAPQNGTEKVIIGRPEGTTYQVTEGQSQPQNVTTMVPTNNTKSDAVKASGLEGTEHSSKVVSEGPKNESKGDKRSFASPVNRSTDKLFHGLLYPGFDESSCLSRYQSILYRKASPHLPSPYLISKLRKYERLHKHCGPHTKSYSRTMNKVARSSRVNGDTLCKYLVWTPANGLGNRMISMLATFLYAVLTDRVLLVRFRTDMLGLFCEPFPNSSWLLPRNFPNYADFDHLETFKSAINDYSSNSLPSILFLNLQRESASDKKFHCDSSQNLLTKVPIVYLRSDQYFVPSLFVTPSFNQELNRMFPNRFTVFHHLGQYLFQPSNEAWGRITRFYEAHMENANERIGLQIRVFNPQKRPLQSVMDQVLSCTTKHNLLPKVSSNESVTFPLLKNLTEKAVLVASLHSEFSEFLNNMYWTRPTISGAIVGIYQASHDEVQKHNDNEQNMKAWTEIYLLSLCDVLVTSGQSTFGYVAQSLGGLKPWILKKGLGRSVPDPPCKRDLSMEPCFHFPPKVDCDSKNEIDVASAFKFIRHCPDRPSGVKLV